MLENLELVKIKKLTTPKIFEKILAESTFLVFVDDIKTNDKIIEFLKD